MISSYLNHIPLSSDPPNNSANKRTNLKQTAFNIRLAHHILFTCLICCIVTNKFKYFVVIYSVATPPFLVHGHSAGVEVSH